MNSSKFMKFLSHPKKIASALNWKSDGSILAIDIGRDRIGMALACHPSTTMVGNNDDVSVDAAVEPLEPIAMMYEKKSFLERRVSSTVVEELHCIVEENRVCGFVVMWPVQKDGGHCGAACGRVLHTLESIVTHGDDEDEDEDDNSSSCCSILTPNRRFCLWDSAHVSLDEDGWGRCPKFGEPSSKTLHIASVEQYGHESSSTLAANMWNDFCRMHWPELYYQQQQQQQQQQQHDNINVLDAFHSTAAYAASGAGGSLSDGSRLLRPIQTKRFSSLSLPDDHLAFAIL